MKNRLASAAAVALLLAACRTSRPVVGEHPVVPLAGGDALTALRNERATLHGARALMRVKAPVMGSVQTFKAAIDVEGDHMVLTAFTPLGTSAMSVTADGDKVHFHDTIHRLDWDATTAQLAQMVPMFPPNVKPAEMAWILLGYPGNDAIEVTAAPAGLATAKTGTVTVTFDPPAHPPQHIVITNGAQTVDVMLLEVAVR